MVKSDYRKYWKLDMLAESAETFFNGKEKIIVNIRSSKKRDSTPEWLVKVMRKEKGYDPKLITTRNLVKTDLDKGQSCLSMPFSQLVNSNFLTEEETMIIQEQRLKIRKDGLKVVLVDPRSIKHVVELRKWDVNGNMKYVINHGWNNVVAMNTFNVEDAIQIWSFRCGQGKLCLALSPPTRSGQSSSRPSSQYYCLKHKQQGI